jgi:predicted ABC-type ATPase
MIPENPSAKQYRYGRSEGYESRSQRRLQDDLGIDQVAAETILHLRRQVVELQAQIQQLETELAAQSASQHMRLARYREFYYEATWIEVEFQE